VIINNNAIEAARCTLPLSTTTQINGYSLGMRHRAGLGITEQADVLSVIVSEETGGISLAEDGQLTRGLSKDALRKRLVKAIKSPAAKGWKGLMEIMQRKPKVAAVIPFFNEVKTLPEIINKTLPFSDIIIAVNDGSTDDFLKHIKINEKIVLITNRKNEGKGFSINRGMKKSIELNSDVTITLDADLQHPPEYIPALIGILDKYDIAIGNRLGNLKGMPFHRILSNKLTSLMLSLKLKQVIADSQCGFRAYKTVILHDILPESKGYEAESEILIKAKRKNYKIGSIEIPTIYSNRKSKMRSFKTIKGFLRVLFT